MANTKSQKVMTMYKNKSTNGRNNICGTNIKKYRLALPNKVSQRKLADLMQLNGLDVDKNVIQRIESGERRVTDIELKIFAKVLNATYEELLRE